MKRNVRPPEVIRTKCNGCRLCIEVCPSFVFEIDEGKASVARGDWCIDCGHCVAVCPVDAVLQRTTFSEQNAYPPPCPGISPETLYLLIRERRSVRTYRTEPVPEDILKRILDAGRYAPTGTNSQNVHYVVLTSSDEIDQLRRKTLHFYEKIFHYVRGRLGRFLLTVVAGLKTVDYLLESLPKVDYAEKRMDQGDDRLFFHAPAVILTHAESWDTCSAFNCSVALYNCSLMAHTLGIGCCFNGFLVSAVNHDRKLKGWLGIPTSHRCYSAMTLGYPKVKYKRLVERQPPKATLR